MKVRTLIVDDMPLARARVRRLLGGEPDIEIVGECSDGREAVRAIRRLAPDLLLLDVQMPEVDGFAVLEEISAEHMPVVIFITAHDEFALKAFEVHALDYLLKPFDRDRFQKALARARSYIERQQQGGLDARLRSLLEDLKAQPRHLRRLAVKSAGRIIFILTEEIDWIETAGNYLCLHSGKESHMLRETMNRLEAKLDPEKFLRIHRSTIVNIDRVKELQPLFNGDQTVTLRDGTQLTLSRNYRDRLLVLLEKPS